MPPPARGSLQPLGTTGVDVTALGLGCAPLGGLFEVVTDEAAQDTIGAAFDVGVRYLDVAPLYGYGLAEQRLGRGLTGHSRESFVVSTKVGRLVESRSERLSGDMFVGAPPGEARFDFTRDGVMRSLDASLERLALERIDVVFIHDPDDYAEEAITQAYPQLAELRAAGVVGAIGVGMNQTALLTRFAEETDVDCILCAGRYTLLDQTALARLLPVCVDRGVAVVIGGVFNSGILADPSPGAHFDYTVAGPGVVARAQELARVCQRHGVPLKAAALQFPIHHPAVVSVLIGARSAAELREGVAMFDYPIPAELWPDLVGRGLLPPSAPVPS
jgi:D-threo-aldose 1-dehydrogenase